MERFTISLDEQLAAAFDDWLARRGYATRSEAVRDLLRAENAALRREAHKVMSLHRENARLRRRIMANAKKSDAAASGVAKMAEALAEARAATMAPSPLRDAQESGG